MQSPRHLGERSAPFLVSPKTTPAVPTVFRMRFLLARRMAASESCVYVGVWGWGWPCFTVNLFFMLSNSFITGRTVSLYLGMSCNPFTVPVLGAFRANVLIYSVTPGPQMSPLGFTLPSLKMQEAAHPFSSPVAPVVHPAVPAEENTGVC